MTVIKAIATIAGTTAGATLLGGIGGYLRGVYNPGYYRNVFYQGHHPAFDPVQVGTGLGIEQGAITGLVIGVLVVAIVAWYDLKRARLAITDVA
ncbi:MAG: hypothetical protein GC164_11520 [Phycisphaera sp.]|nr:hypothetical protein [Phycisphaera sp.]